MICGRVLQKEHKEQGGSLFILKSQCEKSPFCLRRGPDHGTVKVVVEDFGVLEGVLVLEGVTPCFEIIV